MSKIKVNSLEGVGASTPAISIDNTSGACAANITSLNGGQFGNKNKVINGSMVCSQRGVTFSPDNTEQPYTLDRFQHVATSGADGDCTVTQSTDTPHEFKNSYKVTPDATNTPTGGGNVVIRHKIEGQNLQDLAYGTSSAKSLSVSFYAKTGTENSGDQYTLCMFYFRSDGTGKTVNVAFSPTSTWQRFSFTFAGDTDASYGIRDDNQTGMSIMWVLASGPNDIMAAKPTWEVDGAYFRAVTGQNNFMDNTNNEFYLTGVQLEVGSITTSFEHLKSFGQELALCQRYYYQIAPAVAESLIGETVNPDGGADICSIRMPVEMRIEPELVVSDFSQAFRVYASAGTRNPNTFVLNTGVGSTKSVQISVSGGTQGGVGFLRLYNSSGGVYATVALNAEL
jgi:hypothetical protein